LRRTVVGQQGHAHCNARDRRVDALNSRSSFSVLVADRASLSVFRRVGSDDMSASRTTARAVFCDQYTCPGLLKHQTLRYVFHKDIPTVAALRHHRHALQGGPQAAHRAVLPWRHRNPPLRAPHQAHASGAPAQGYMHRALPHRTHGPPQAQGWAAQGGLRSRERPARPPVTVTCANNGEGREDEGRGGAGRVFEGGQGAGRAKRPPCVAARGEA